MAFGGSAADALFGAGSGTALTTITKYSAGIFFGLALLLAIMGRHLTPASGGAFEDALSKPGTASSQPASPLLPATSTNLLQMPSPAVPAPSNSSVPAASSNSAVPPAAPVQTPKPAAPVPPATPSAAAQTPRPAAAVPAPSPATNR